MITKSYSRPVSDFLSKYKSTLPSWHHFTPALSGWSTVDFDVLDVFLPDSPAVYALVGKKKKILYVGQSSNIRKRFLSGHHNFFLFLREGVTCLKYCIVPSDATKQDRELIEAAYINYISPPLNGAYPYAFSRKDMIPTE
jgi:hypothetical protein